MPVTIKQATPEPKTKHQIELVDPVTDAEERALAIANSFREKIGEPKIDGIIPGITGSSHDCVLARTFNADCTVGYEANPAGRKNDDGEAIDAQFGWALFADGAVAKSFAEAVNEHLLQDESPVEVDQDGGYHDTQRSYKVNLPTPVAQIAVDFDHNDLADQFDESTYDGFDGFKPIKEVLGLTK